MAKYRLVLEIEPQPGDDPYLVMREKLAELGMDPVFVDGGEEKQEAEIRKLMVEVPET